MSDEDTINIAPKPATMSEALPHAANRVRLAKAEQADARIALMHAKNALKRAEEHMARCDEAAARSIERLARLAEAGRVDAYCRVHDVFYSFEPQVPKREDGRVDHYTKHEDFWTNGAPPCPECAALRRAVVEKGAGEQSRQNWML